MERSAHIIRAGFVLALLPLLTAAADDSCRLCGPAEKVEKQAERREIPLSIDITTSLDFSKAALAGTGGGQIELDADGTQRNVVGLIDLGGYPMAGSAVIRGEPGRLVRVDMPAEVRMTSSTGGVIRILAMQTNLPPAPRLDGSGQLKFSFGGRLEVSGNVAGAFRGRIPITADYE